MRSPKAYRNPLYYWSLHTGVTILTPTAATGSFCYAAISTHHIITMAIGSITFATDLVDTKNAASRLVLSKKYRRRRRVSCRDIFLSEIFVDVVKYYYCCCCCCCCWQVARWTTVTISGHGPPCCLAGPAYDYRPDVAPCRSLWSGHSCWHLAASFDDGRPYELGGEVLRSPSGELANRPHHRDQPAERLSLVTDLGLQVGSLFGWRCARSHIFTTENRL